MPLAQERRAERAQEPLHAPLRARAQEARAEELPRGAHATPRRHVVEADRAFELRLHLAVEPEDFRVVRHRVNLRAQSAPSGEHRRVLSARARRVRAHERKRPVEVAELETLPRERAANPVVPVLDRRQNRVERPDLFDDRAAQERRVDDHDVLVDEREQDRAPCARHLRHPRLVLAEHRVEPLTGPLRAEKPDAAVDDVCPGVRFEKLDLALELERLDEVVGVEELNVTPAGRGKPRVLRDRLPLVLLPKVTHARLAFDEARDHVGCVVGRAVVNDDALPVFVSLRAQTFECLRDEARVVVGRHDDAHERPGLLSRTS